jgi:DNA-binding CsgD family transcriptional regulator
MPTHRQLEVAARIGALVADPCSEHAVASATRLVADALHADACSLVGVDPATGRHRGLAAFQYTDQVADVLAVQFVQTPWFDMVLDDALPPSISTEPTSSFRDGWFYADHLQPAGFRDGMTAPLRRGGRYVGLVHLSSGHDRRFDTDARRTLRAVLPALGELVDPLSGPAGAPSSGSTRAALVQPGRVLVWARRELPRACADDEFRQVVEDFAQCARECGPAGAQLRLLWPDRTGWLRIRLGPALGTMPGVLIEEQSCAAPHGLSARELDVLTRIALGMSNTAIAEDLTVSPRTVHTHVGHLLRKLGAQSRSEACGRAGRQGLVRPVPGLLLRRGAQWLIEGDAFG